MRLCLYINRTTKDYPFYRVVACYINKLIMKIFLVVGNSYLCSQEI